MNEDDEEQMDQTSRSGHIASKLAEGAYHGEEDWKLLLALAMAISEIDKLEDRDEAGDIFDKIIDALTFAHLHVIRYDDEEVTEQQNSTLPPITEDEIADLSRRLFGKKEED